MGHTRGRRKEKKDRKFTEVAGELNDDFIPLDAADPVFDGTAELAEFSSSRDNRASFFGLLDRSELEYFKNAESMLATNALNADERAPFIENVFAEAKGRELKLATNQVCSKLLERLTQLATEEQMQQLLAAFEPFAVDLAFQKFSSHCLEASIARAINIPSCEDKLANIAKRFAAVLGDFVHDKYASHVLQTLIVTLGGIDHEMRSRRSKLARKHTEIEAAPEPKQSVSAEPSGALKKEARDIVTALIDTIPDKAQARKLAIDPIASALVQTLIVAEAALKSGYKLLGLIFDDADAEGFVSHCLSDPVGAHFLETAIRIMPAKRMAQFVEKYMPIAKLATSEMEAANYLVLALLDKSHLPPATKTELVRTHILPKLSAILDRNAAIVTAALDVDFAGVAGAVVAAFDQPEHELNLRDPRKAALFEALAKHAPFVDRATDAVVALSHDDVRDMALDPTQSYVLQHLLNPAANIVTRRKLVNKVIPLIPQLSVNAYGSHIVDALWPACYKLKFNRERTATELAKHAEQVKHSPYGRKVWHNWRMEKYEHKRHEWWQAVKAVEDELRAELEPAASSTPGGKPAQKQRAAADARPLDRTKRRKTTA